MVAEHPGKSDVVFLPMIDLSASDDTCVYSTLYFIANQGQKCGFHPIVTFDQPLWWKAMLIIAEASLTCPTKKIVLKLGFHALMSFLGSIGHLISGLGLNDVLEVAYAGNTIPHIMSGKAIGRAIRGHTLIESALHVILHEDSLLNSDYSSQVPIYYYLSFWKNDYQLHNFLEPNTEEIDENLSNINAGTLSKDELNELANLFNTMIDGKLSARTSHQFINVTESPRTD